MILKNAVGIVIRKNVEKKCSFYDRKGNCPKNIVIGMLQNLYVKKKQINSLVYYFFI